MGSQYAVTIRSWQDADRYRKEHPRRKSGTLIYHNTRLHWDKRADVVTYTIVYYGASIVEYYDDGEVYVANANGYRTVTTKQRYNNHLPVGWGIFQRKWEWWYWHWINGVSHEHTFRSGLLSTFC